MIVVAPLHEVDEAIARWQPSHVVSLASPGSHMAEFPTGVASLRLAFHDIAEPRTGLQPPTEADVRALLAFGLAWPAERPLLIHCWAGVSRSPAAAYVIACARHPDVEMDHWAAALRRAAPFATPNPAVVALADAIFQRDGSMAAAISAIGRGAETSLGRSFALDA